jgi:hypothetical protein
MKRLGWIFFITTLSLSAYLVYFYYFRYVPLETHAELLEKENRVIKDSLLAALDKITPRSQRNEPKLQSSYDLKYSLKDFFSGNSAELTSRGVEALNKLYSSISAMPFDTVMILLYPGGNLQATRALKIKSYLVSLGMDETKTFARVNKSGEKDFIIIRVK